MKEKMKSAFIFDMDGVLIDSEPIYKIINTAIFKQIGAFQCIEEYDKYIGSSLHEMWTDVKSKCDTIKTIETLNREGLDGKFDYISREGIEPIKNIPEFVIALKSAGFSLAVASGSPLKNIQLILDKINLKNHFDYLAGYECVTKGKPEPDIFLHVAEKLNINPANCVVIEDSAHGIAAAKRAGMFCIAYANPNSGKQNLSSADKVIDDFSTIDCIDLHKQISCR